MRKLASIQRILDIQPIEGADFIMKARVMGWDTIVRKDEFRIGDYCVFFEVDAVLPEAEWSAFLKNRRIKTMKLRGVLSQGLALPLGILEGADVTELTCVVKHENEPTANAFDALPWPSFIPKTDEERLQSALGVLDELRGQPYQITVKLDGQSMTAWYDDQLHICSRNYELKRENGGALWAFAERVGLEDTLRQRTHIAFQGELCGPGIQANRLGLKETDWFIFNTYSLIDHRYISYAHPLNHVPLEEIGADFQYTLEELLEKAGGMYPSGLRREGIVIRPLTEMHSDTLHGRLSFKVISNDYLLKDEK